MTKERTFYRPSLLIGPFTLAHGDEEDIDIIRRVLNRNGVKELPASKILRRIYSNEHTGLGDDFAPEFDPSVVFKNVWEMTRKRYEDLSNVETGQTGEFGDMALRGPSTWLTGADLEFITPQSLEAAQQRLTKTANRTDEIIEQENREYARMFRERLLTIPWNWEWQEGNKVDELTDLFSDPKTELMLLKDDGKEVGFALIIPLSGHGKNAVEFKYFSLYPGMEGRRRAKPLFDKVLHHLYYDRGFDKVVWWQSHTNVNFLGALYESFGAKLRAVEAHVDFRPLPFRSHPAFKPKPLTAGIENGSVMPEDHRLAMHIEEIARLEKEIKTLRQNIIDSEQPSDHPMRMDKEAQITEIERRLIFIKSNGLDPSAKGIEKFGQPLVWADPVI